ncbi:MAG: hypothetical protein PHQ36_02875 [Anaerolineales bacterium]|nr:hypothetical protein [Anaerolineales bacterium]
MNSETLTQLFDFDQSELNANRNGLISEKQKLRLKRNERSQRGWFAVLGVFLAIMALVGVRVAVATTLTNFQDDRGGTIAMICAFGILWPLVWGSIGFFSIRRAVTKTEFKLKKTEGPVNIIKVIRDEYDSSSNLTHQKNAYQLRVGRRAFDVNWQLAGMMMQGDVYAVYYAEPNLRGVEASILSVELLEQAK